MKVLLIVNPCSGRLKAKTALFDIIQVFCKAGHIVTTHMTLKRGNATEVAAKAYEDEYEMVVCCGGDGTLNEVVNGLLQSEKVLPLGYIPAGSTNDFARTLGLETDLVKAAKAIINCKDKCEIDVGNFSFDRNFVYIASFGLFTSSSYHTEQSAKNALGHIAYVFDGIANMGNFETYHVSFKADGKDFEGDYVYGGITNSTSVGGMFKFDGSLVDLSDGLFEVLMVKMPKNANDFMNIVSGITSCNFSDSSVFDFCKASKIELTMPSNVVWSLDGEAAKGRTNTVIENLPKKLTILR